MKRVPAIDWMRGLVMIIMTIDHASGAFNGGHLLTDGAFLYKPGTPLPMAQFFTRWITHLCAPTFVFLAGVSIALSKRVTDRFLVTRGLILIALEPLWMSWMFVGPGRVLLQVLWAIGGSFVCMAVLRHRSSKVLLAIACAILIFGEWVGSTLPRSLPGAMLLSAGFFGWLIAAYPLLPWLAIMLLGFVFGRNMNPRTLLVGGVLALAAFALIRGIDGYGNAGLHREDGSLVQWLHVSKYPPSLSFVSLELGLMALILAAFFALKSEPAWTKPLLVFGQTAFFFYLLHAHLLKLAAWLLHLVEKGGLRETYLSWIVVLLALYPACLAYRRYKQANPLGFTRYV